MDRLNTTPAHAWSREERAALPARGFQIEVDKASPDEWSRMLDAFEDASLYQTWAYGAVRWGASKLSHLVLRRDGLVVGMAQLAVAALPYPRVGMAHLRWGPICQRKGQALEPEVVERMAAALRDEYVVRRKLFLRLHPLAHNGTARGDAFERAFDTFDAKAFRPGESYRTLLVDLTLPLEEIRKGLDQKWRNQLNRAERNELVVRDVDGIDGFVVFSRLHREMSARKGLPEDPGVDEFASMQSRLPAGQRMKVLICEQQGTPVAGIVGTGIGNTGVYVLGATSDEGMKSKGAYLLQWRMIEWLKAQGVAWYDLGGINPETNPGVYHFKKGLSGSDVLYACPRELSGSALSGVLARLVQMAKDRRRRRGAAAVSTGEKTA